MHLPPNEEMKELRGVPVGVGLQPQGGGWAGGRAALERAGEKGKRAWLRPAPRSNFKVNCPADFCIFWAEMRVLKLLPCFQIPKTDWEGELLANASWDPCSPLFRTGGPFKVQEHLLLYSEWAPSILNDCDGGGRGGRERRGWG